MRKYLILVVLASVFVLFLPASAKQAVSAVYGETYFCGDSFEIVIRGEPFFTSAVTRSPGSKLIHAQAGPDDILLEIRIQIRNLTPMVYNGLSPESFKLVGYVRGRPISYTPEIMEPYDYGGKGSYVMYDKNYYRTAVFAPLRKIDMILVYRLNPILRDLELHINPQSTKDISYEYLDAVYEEKDLEPCDGIFMFTTIRTLETGEITKYYR